MKKLIFTLGFMLVLFLHADAQLQQDSIDKAFATSLALEKANDYKGAIKVINSVYLVNNYELNLKLGYLHYYAGQYKESMGYYKKAIDLMPGGIEARMGFVYSASGLGKWDDVKEQYKKILHIDPNNSFVNYNLGLIFYNNREYSNAYKHFEKVYRLYPFDYSNMLMFAWCNLQLYKNPEAKALFKKVLQLAPYDSSAMEGLKLINK